MLRAWMRWRKFTDLSNRTFLKFYIYDRLIIRPKGRLRRWLR